VKRLLITLPMIAALALGACGDDDPTGPEDPVPQELAVLSWNVYVGADLTQLLAVEDPAQIACGVAAVYDDVLATEFETRAVAIADQIEALEPHVIGLNEVSTFAFAGNTVHEDLVFLDVLLAELTARGLDYAAPEAARSTNFEISLPISYAVDCTPQDLLSYTEYDVLLVQGETTPTTGGSRSHCPFRSGSTRSTAAGHTWTSSTRARRTACSPLTSSRATPARVRRTMRDCCSYTPSRPPS
jgi:hypothetical protein